MCVCKHANVSFVSRARSDHVFVSLSSLSISHSLALIRYGPHAFYRVPFTNTDCIGRERRDLEIVASKARLKLISIDKYMH